MRNPSPSFVNVQLVDEGSIVDVSLSCTCA